MRRFTDALGLTLPIGRRPAGGHPSRPDSEPARRAPPCLDRHRGLARAPNGVLDLADPQPFPPAVLSKLARSQRPAVTSSRSRARSALRSTLPTLVSGT